MSDGAQRGEIWRHNRHGINWIVGEASVYGVEIAPEGLALERPLVVSPEYLRRNYQRVDG